MKTYNAMNSLINDYSSIENVLGEFLSINITEDDFGSFLRKIHSQKKYL